MAWPTTSSSARRPWTPGREASPRRRCARRSPLCTTVWTWTTVDAAGRRRGARPPGGAFVVGWRDGEPVCCGGLKRLSEGTCEIKKMYVGPAARGQGVARALLHELELTALGLGYPVARLDTGPRQVHAQSLCADEGHQAVDDFNGNPVAVFWGEKRLVGTAEAPSGTACDIARDVPGVEQERP
ncbi:MAG: GNAT family N-acetyltransferase [Actinomycetota bacterium]|nr:GNAT family N-acetyltransferase [Actinomycetota bacterium]